MHPNIPPHRQTGFTLLGLLFLIAGLGVGLAALGTLWHTAVQREKERELLFVGDQYRRAIESFWTIPLPVGEPRRLPRSLEELLLDPRFPDTVRHLRRPYPDPMSGKPEWGLIRGAAGGIAGIHSLSDAKPFKTGNFPTAYASFSGQPHYRGWAFISSAAAEEIAAANNAVTTPAADASLPQTSAPPAPEAGEPGDSGIQRQFACDSARVRGLNQCRREHGASPSDELDQCMLMVRVAHAECLAGDTGP